MFPRLNRPSGGPSFFECRPVSNPSSALRTPAFRFASVSAHGEPGHGHGSVLWSLRRNCSVTPAQLGWLYLSLCFVSLGIATFFWVQGARAVMPFAWLELLAVGSAFVVYARHARDGEKILLQGGQLVVELESAGRTERAEFNRDWVRIEPKDGDGSLIEVSGQGRSVRVGRHVRPELRPELAREIRYALRAC
ncbi:MAG: putative transrane protein [Polaromonas sp.]|nr:putative transrane protein [Polaromonas sp.]